MPGTRHRIRIATAIRITKGNVPQMMSDSGMSGAMFLMTKMFRPTGGWIRPISMVMVITTPNHTRSKPAA